MENREYKSNMFCNLFGSEENKRNALELYNAVNGSAYGNPEEIEITTLEDVVFIGRKNDVSFAFHDQMVFWEHQSTKNPNMPMRFLIYMAELYSRRFAGAGSRLYGSKLVQVETPRFVVFYNGRDEMPDRWSRRLSDAFLAGEGDVDLTVTVINVNAGRNRAIMEASETLAGYARFVELVRMWQKELPLAEAAERAIDQCIEEGVLVEYLSKNRESAVMSVLCSGFDEVLEYRNREAFEDGVGQGVKQGVEQESSRFARALRDMGVDEAIIQEAMKREAEE